jgi:DnaK suppressor protein
MTSASKGTSVKKAPVARAAAASKSGTGTKTSSSKAGASVAKRSGAKTNVDKDANRTVSKAAGGSKRAMPTTEKGSTARKTASQTNNTKSASTTAKKAAASGVKKTSTEKRPGATNAAKKASGAQKTATPTKAGVAPPARTSVAKKAGSRSAKEAATVLATSSEASTSAMVSGGAPAANGAVAGRSTLGPKPKPAPVRPKTGPYAKDAKFLDEMRDSLLEERAIYQEQATSLRAEADSLALEREPGDVQFDEESGEGGTVTVDRERNLALSGQAAMAVEEIDAAMARIDEKTYGYCERCFQPVPKPRLRALPYARLCVACKSGGLSRR